MEFNPALMRYEPSLPLKKSHDNKAINIDWKWVIFILLSIIVFIAITISLL